MHKETACKACALRALGSFATNTQQEIAFIEKFKKRERCVLAGAAIVREKTKAAELYTLLSGWAFRYRTLSDGRRQILNFLLPGDFIGLQEEVSGDSAYGVEALTDAVLCVFPPDKLWQLYRGHPTLGYDLTWISAHQELIIDENLVSVGRRSALERTAMLIVHLFRRAQASGMEKNSCVPFPITQQHIADALGQSLVHTNKTLRRLQAAAFYKLENGQLCINDLAALQQLAEYDPPPRRPRPLI
jgi:CRP/FNR family transcriptional regulator, anaerobic regulatory protein